MCVLRPQVPAQRARVRRAHVARSVHCRASEWAELPVQREPGKPGVVASYPLPVPWGCRAHHSHIAAARMPEVEEWARYHQPQWIAACPLCHMAAGDQRHARWCWNCSAANRPKRVHGGQQQPRDRAIDAKAAEFNKQRHERWLAPREKQLQRMFHPSKMQAVVKQLVKDGDSHFTKTNKHYQSDQYPVTTALRIMPPLGDRACRPPLRLMCAARPYQGAHQTVCAHCRQTRQIQPELQQCKTCQYSRHRDCGKDDQTGPDDTWTCKWCDSEGQAREASAAHWRRLNQAGVLSQEVVHGATAGPWDLMARGHIPRKLWQMGKQAEKERKRSNESRREFCDNTNEDEERRITEDNQIIEEVQAAFHAREQAMNMENAMEEQDMENALHTPGRQRTTRLEQQGQKEMQAQLQVQPTTPTTDDTPSDAQTGRRRRLDMDMADGDHDGEDPGDVDDAPVRAPQCVAPAWYEPPAGVVLQPERDAPTKRTYDSITDQACAEIRRLTLEWAVYAQRHYMDEWHLATLVTARSKVAAEAAARAARAAIHALTNPPPPRWSDRAGQALRARRGSADRRNAGQG